MKYLQIAILMTSFFTSYAVASDKFVSGNEIRRCMKDSQNKVLKFSNGILGYKAHDCGCEYEFEQYIDTQSFSATLDDDTFCDIAFSRFSKSILTSRRIISNTEIGKIFKNWIVYLNKEQQKTYLMKDYNDKYVYFSINGEIYKNFMVPRNMVKSCDRSSIKHSDRVSFNEYDDFEPLPHCVFKDKTGNEFTTKFFIIKGSDFFKMNKHEYNAVILEPINMN